MRAIAQERDRDAFAALFHRHGPQLKSYLLRVGTPVDRVDDLVQEVMLLVWRKAASFDPARASLNAWLFTIARNKRVELHRRARWPEDGREDPARIPGPDATPFTLASAAESERALRAALRELPAEQAETLAAAYFRGQSMQSISEATGAPVGTVKSRIRLAIARLREALDARRGDA